MKKRKKPAARKIVDLKDQIEAYRVSAIGAGKARRMPGNLALASAAAGGAALAVAPAAEAAIQYSGQPAPVAYDVLTNKATEIDIDGDGDIDIRLSQFSEVYTDTSMTGSGATITLGPYTYNYASVSPKNGAAIVVSSGGTYAKALSANYNIANTLAGTGVWNFGSKYYYLGYSNSGPFPNQGNKYIGIRFTNTGTGQTHYGWVQVNVAAGSSSLTIVDWAWEDTPNTPIMAGATSGGGGAEPVPTLTEWGMIALITLLAGAAALKMRRREELAV